MLIRRPVRGDTSPRRTQRWHDQWPPSDGLSHEGGRTAPVRRRLKRAAAPGGGNVDLLGPRQLEPAQPGLDRGHPGHIDEIVSIAASGPQRFQAGPKAVAIEVAPLGDAGAAGWAE